MKFEFPSQICESQANVYPAKADVFPDVGLFSAEPVTAGDIRLRSQASKRSNEAKFW